MVDNTLVKRAVPAVEHVEDTTLPSCARVVLHSSFVAILLCISGTCYMPHPADTAACCVCQARRAKLGGKHTVPATYTTETNR